MRTKLLLGLAAASLSALALAGCSSPAPATSPDTGSTGSGGSGYDEPAPSTSDDATSDNGAATGSLALADSSLGEIVVDGAGLSVYVYDADTQGAQTSACTGSCLQNWPLVLSDTATPEVDGVTGEVGTIPGPDGEFQVTLDGWPLYYFAGDAQPGDVNGQAVGGVWWVVGPDGSRIGNE